MASGKELQEQTKKKQQLRGTTDVQTARAGTLRPMLGGSPFGIMRRMMEDIERLFDSDLQTMWNPRIDLLETGDELIVRADLPGMDRGNVRLELTDDGLVLGGERQEEHEEKDEGFYRRERTHGSFQRLIPLPEGVDQESVTAEMKNGVLEVRFKRQERRERKRIEIGEGPQEQESGATPVETKSVH